MVIFNQILYYINQVFIILFSAAFTLQLIYVLLFFLKPKKYKPATKQHRFGIIIPARNESAVIGDTIKNLFSQNYPRELYDIFVVADNCTDNTAEIAREAGAIVFERFDDDPNHKRASYALKFGFQKILKDYDNYDAFIKFDADNFAHPDYFSKMNDAFESGVEIARPYSNSKNLTANMSSKISGLYYIRNSRFSCSARSALGTSQMLTGAGLMVSANIIRDIDGWDAMSISDDTQFAMKRILEGKKTHYVSEAICYEDQPESIKDTFNRNKRFGKGINKIFFNEGLRSFFKFFVTFRYAYLDMFLELLFVPMSLVACIWFPLYYGYDIIFNLVQNNIPYVLTVLKTLGKVLLFAFYLPFVIQGLLCVVLEHKRMLINSPKEILPAVFVFPFYMIIYCISIAFGILSKPKWKAITRSTAKNIGKAIDNKLLKTNSSENIETEKTDTVTFDEDDIDGIHKQ